jgi:hypothetical protein
MLQPVKPIGKSGTGARHTSNPHTKRIHAVRVYSHIMSCNEELPTKKLRRMKRFSCAGIKFNRQKINSAHSVGQVIALFTQFRPDYYFYFLWSKGQNFFPTLGGQIIYFILFTNTANSEISWFCFDFPKWGPVSFIITDFSVFVQFFE